MAIVGLQLLKHNSDITYIERDLSERIKNSIFCSRQGNHNADSISQRIAGLEQKLSELEGVAGQRRGGLVDNSAFLQFMWKTDVVDSWIG